MSTDGTGAGPIRSDFDNDPEMRELIDLFVSEMPTNASRLSDLFEGRQIEDLQRLASRIKGAAGGYGFGVIRDAARNLEEAIETIDDLDAMRDQVDQLIDLCQRTKPASRD
ncbi:MAG: Hpt domain-containing protein [Phycisphaeraceae bacterium]|nr:Hpt domain-containing protein [Phycisphaeraceae bacterium]